MNRCSRLLSQLSDAQINLMKRGLPNKKRLTGVNKIILVSSAKGGVGKSTVASNLAIALLDHTANKSIGLLDADIFGPSQPHLFNLSDMKPDTNDNKQMIPLVNYGVKVMSIGFLIDQSSAVVWRGLMVMSAIERLLFHVSWGNLDCLVIDMPPGTGDVPLSICQRLEIDGSILVTTRQPLAMIDARRGRRMFDKMQIPIIGYVNNMSQFQCPSCHSQHEIFGRSDSTVFDGGIDLLAELPIENRYGGDKDIGQPIMIFDPESEISSRYRELALTVWKKLNK